MRFQPDTWVEALLRPIAMASPDANVYIEIMAPDFRFAFVLGLLALLGTMGVLLHRKAGAGERGTARPVFLLLAAVAVGFVPWLAASGNGRYFLVGLLAVGPVCVGLARLLPATRALRLTLVVLMLALQAFAVQQAAPWRAWAVVPWQQAPYFAVDLPPQVRTEPATYVTMSAISYSLLAPMFHPDSRWISLNNAPAPDSALPDARRTEAFLAKAQPGHLMLLVPAVAGMLTPEGLPNTQVSQAIGAQLAPYRLAFGQPQSCRFLPSASVAAMGLGAKSAQERARSGFWLCHLARVEAGAAPKSARGHRYDAVFQALENQCPRFFPPGGDAGSIALGGGELRSYLQSEMKAYVDDSGEVTYKYYRALNPVRVGTIDELLAGRARVDCGNIRGRSGLPWDREI